MIFKFLQTTCLLGALSVAVVTVNANIAQGGMFPRLNQSVVPALSRRSIPQLEARGMTNAKRLAAGLPVKAPHRRASGTSAARRSDPSSVPTYVQGYIEAFQVGTSDSRGYVTGLNDGYGVFGLTMNPTQYVKVSVPTSVVPAPFSLRMTNAPNPTYPFFGAIESLDSTDASIGSGNANYLYVGGTGETGSRSTPNNNVGSTFQQSSGNSQASVESAIWSYDPSTNTLTPQWRNPDSSAPNTNIAYQGQYLVLTGDISTTDAGKSWNSIPLYFTFVPV